MYESFKDTCPHCGSQDLVVVEATLVATGERLTMCSSLSVDGFSVPAPDDLKDCSTEDEIVLCRQCGKKFPLADVTL